MVLLHQWNLFYLLITAVATGKTVNGIEKDIIHAIVGEPFIIRTWSLNGSRLFINVTRGNDTRLETLLDENVGNHITIKNGQMLLKYNDTVKKAFLMFQNVSKEDGGLYEMKESFNRTKAASYEIEAEAYERKYGTWTLEINVLEPGEVKQGYVGANISMEFGKLSGPLTLYNYDQRFAVLSESICAPLMFSHLYSRIKCTNDKFDKMYTITIDNVTLKDAGVYKLVKSRGESGRYFFNITDGPTFAAVGDNMTIRWFYNQQGIKRTLRVIHPNQEVMMLLPQTNVPQINNNFQNRLLYSGDVAESFMLLLLMNLRQYDAGLYTIETLHGNTIPGSKQLIVQDIATTSKPSTVKRETSSIMVPHYAPTNSPYDQHSTVRADIVTSSTSSTVKHDTSSIMVPHHALTNSTYYQQSTLKAEENTINVQRNRTSTLETVSVPIYLVPVIIVSVGVVSLMICCLIRIRRKNTSGMEPDRPHALEECDTDLYLTPIGAEMPLSIPLRNDGRAGHSNTTQNTQFDSSMRLLHRTQSICMDGYEMIDISCNDDPESTLNNEENIYDSTETINTPFEDTSGYLTVLGVLETAV